MRFRIPTITLAVVIAFCAVNIYTYFTMYTPIAHGMAYFGWPFKMYTEGGFATTSKVFLTEGFCGNVVVALYAAGIANFAFTAIKIFGSPNLK